MIETLSPSNAQFLQQLNKLSAKMARAQDQMSSGLKVKTVSDAPDEVSEILQLRASLDSNTQIRTNLGQVKTEVDSAESSLETAVGLLEKIRSIGTQGATSLQTPSGRADLAGQITSLLENLTGITQTQINSRFLFSGDSDTVAPYTYDATQTPAMSAYAGSASTRKVTLPTGIKISISKTAQEIFDTPADSTSVFGSIAALRDALLANDDAGISSAVANVGKAGNYLNQQLGFYGNIQNQVAQSLKDADTRELQIKTQISGIEEADVASAILELQSATTEQNAALAAHAQIPRTTLFDYLK